MRNRVHILGLGAALVFSSLLFGQSDGTQKPETPSGKAASPAPATKHDISGLWDPTPPRAGVQASGPRNMPNDGKPEHEVPYTPYGLQVYNTHKTLEGPHAVPTGLDNDPRNRCEPLGFPRMNWHYLMATEIVQTEAKVLILYEYDQRWREIVMNQQ